MKVIKRDGREVPFDYTRVKNAIEAANGEVAEADRLTDMVNRIIKCIIIKRLSGKAVFSWL